MEIVIVRVWSVLVIICGIFLIKRPNIVADKLKKIYSKYPIIRYAGDKQLTCRPQLIVIAGIVIIIVGLFCLFSV